MLIFWAALLYFAMVFTTGFLLGSVRTVFVVPRLGARNAERKAELLESPLMLVAIVLSARFVVARVPGDTVQLLETGFLALALTIAAELLFAGLIRRISLRQYFRTRDRVSGTVYYLLLLIFALMPLFVSRY